MMKKLLAIIFIAGCAQAAQNGVPMDTDAKSRAAAMETEADQKALVAVNGMQTDGERKQAMDVQQVKKPIHHIALGFCSGTGGKFSDYDKKRVAWHLKQALKRGNHPDQCFVVNPNQIGQTLLEHADKWDNPYVLYIALKNGAALWDSEDCGKYSPVDRIKRHDFSSISNPIIAHMLYKFGKVTSFRHALACTEFPEMYQSDCNKQNIAKMPLFFYMHDANPLETVEYNDGEGIESPFENFVEHSGYPLDSDDDYQSIKQWISRMVRIGVPYNIDEDRSSEEISQIRQEDEQDEMLSESLVEEIESAKREVQQAREAGKQIISQCIPYQGPASIVMDYLAHYIECPSITREVAALQKELDDQFRSCEQQYQTEKQEFNGAPNAMMTSAEPE